MSELPKGWFDASLEEVVLFKKGTKPKILIDQKKEGFIPYIDIRAFEKNEIRQFADVGSSKISTKNDILVVWDGARCGLAGMGKEGAIGSTIMCLTPIEGRPKYLYYFLRTEYDNINSDNKGTGIPHVKPELFWNLQVPIAPLNEQKRIVKKLDNLLTQVDESKRRLEKIPVILKRFRQSVLNAAVTGELTKDWKEKTKDIKSSDVLLNEIICSRKQEYEKLVSLWELRKAKKPSKDYEIEFEKHPEINTWSIAKLENLIYIAGRIGWRGLKAEEYTKAGPLFLSVYNLNNGLIVDLTDTYHISKERYDESPEIQLKENDILLAKDGAGIGKIAILKNLKEQASVNSSLLVIRSLEAFNPEYLLYFLAGPELQNLAKQRITGSATPHLFQKDIKEFKLTVPPLEEQKEIVKRVEVLFKKADEIEERYKKAKAYVDKLTQSILAKAFRGELVPQDPNDPPASELLEIIKLEKEKMSKEKGKKEKVIEMIIKKHPKALKKLS